MAKKNYTLIRLVSSGVNPDTNKPTGYFKVRTKSIRPKSGQPQTPIALKMFDPIIKKHVLFNEKKIK